ncbi:hypothetical protein EXIGLDRAFT_758097 [Exidia glandulosa HHB12029]|uniref:Uncharacterized protein n=1 Tax=Exidia glandulosa HHB12029 TaxID=1314781 RepID=A0A165QL50_EXIGL|nr:hypothetical protein EXIGLDRAFT_758097 [Exidia glandulosa HHB12029]
MPRGVLGNFKSEALKTFPVTVSVDDLRRLEKLERTYDYSIKVPVYEELADKYSHPFFSAQVGCMLLSLRANSLAIRRWQEAQLQLKDMGIQDSSLDSSLDLLAPEFERVAYAVLTRSKTFTFSQPWRNSSTHEYPSLSSLSLSRYNALRMRWEASTDAIRQRYMRRLCIETVHIEDVFLLSESSVEELVHRRVTDSVIVAAPQSALHSPEKIKNILTDTLAAYQSVLDLAADPSALIEPASALFMAF